MHDGNSDQIRQGGSFTLSAESIDVILGSKSKNDIDTYEYLGNRNDWCLVKDICDALHLSRSPISNALNDGEKDGITRKQIKPGDENKYRPAYMWALAEGVTLEQIQKVKQLRFGKDDKTTGVELPQKQANIKREDFGIPAQQEPSTTEEALSIVTKEKPISMPEMVEMLVLASERIAEMTQAYDHLEERLAKIEQILGVALKSPEAPGGSRSRIMENLKRPA